MTVETKHVANLWNNSANHDKLYRIEVTQTENGFDVLAAYGRRGGKMTLHVYADSLSKAEAMSMYTTKLQEKRRKGYKAIVEDVMAVENSIPTWVN